MQQWQEHGSEGQELISSLRGFQDVRQVERGTWDGRGPLGSGLWEVAMCVMAKARVHSFSDYCAPPKLSEVLESWKPQRWQWALTLKRFVYTGGGWVYGGRFCIVKSPTEGGGSDTGGRQASQTMGVRVKPAEMEGRGKSDSHFGLGTGRGSRKSLKVHVYALFLFIIPRPLQTPGLVSVNHLHFLPDLICF